MNPPSTVIDAGMQITLTVDAATMMVIMKGIDELPGKEGRQLWLRFNDAIRQAAEQEQAKAKPAAPEKPALSLVPEPPSDA